MNIDSIGTNYGKWLYFHFSLSGVSDFKTAMADGLIPSSVLFSSIIFYNNSNNLINPSISDFIKCLGNKASYPGGFSVLFIDDLVAACQAISLYFGNIVLPIEEIAKIGYQADFKLYKGKGKCAYSGVTFSGSSEPWSNDFTDQLVLNQNAVVPGAMKEHTAVFTDTVVNMQDPNYRYSVTRAILQ